jgi:hypothetical protein
VGAGFKEAAEVDTAVALVGALDLLVGR